MIELANGQMADVFTASGAYGFDGRGWLRTRVMERAGMAQPAPWSVVKILKTLTMKPRVGNYKPWAPWECVRRITQTGEDITFQPWLWKPDDCFVNAFGLTNPGFFKFFYGDLRRNVERGMSRCVLSLMFDTPQDYSGVLPLLTSEYCDNIVGIELNASCPNSGESLDDNTQHVIACVRAARTATMLPLLLKISPENDYLEVLRGVQDCGVIVDAINAPRWSTVFPHLASPLEHLGGGGVSGPAIVALRDTVCRRIRKEFPRVPIVLGGGIWDRASYKEALDLMPDAVSIGTAILKDPDFIARELHGCV